jgi:prepilin-type processing-associated H-X9-DG protein
LTNGYQSPNSRIPDLVTHFTGYFGPRSWHTSGAHAALADGSVRFLSDSMNNAVCRSVHSRSGNEATGDF